MTLPRRTSIMLVATLALGACSDRAPGQSASGLPPGNDDSGGSSFSASIIEPNGDVSILAGGTLRLRGEFTSAGSPVTPESVRWTLSGVFIGDTNPFATEPIAAGVRVITLEGTLAGRSASASITVSAGDFAVAIDRPSDGRLANEGDNLDFTGTAQVVDGSGSVRLVSGAPANAAERTATFEWRSSLDGLFGSQGDFPYDLLSTGQHRITLTVRDDLTGGSGRSGSAVISLTIRPPNSAPVVSITDPVCPATIESGQTLALSGTVTDADAADAGLTGSWLESVSGAVTAGNSMSFGTGAALGKHQLTFSATDSQGDSDSAVCDVWVVPAGGSSVDLFVDSGAINAALAGADPNIRWIGSDGAGSTLIGNDSGLTIVSGTGASSTYDGAALGVGAGAVGVTDFALAGATAFVATETGLAQCGYVAGALSGCSGISGDNVAAVEATGDVANVALVAAAADGGLLLASYDDGALTGSLLLDDGNSNLPSNQVQDVLWLAGKLYVATDAGLCVADEPAAALTSTAGTIDLCRSTLTNDNSVLPDNDVTALAGGDGSLWIGSDGGLARLDAGGSMQEIDLGIGGVTVADIALDANGVVWIASDRGLLRLTGDSVTQLTGVDWGSPGDNLVSSIFIDAGGVKWLATQDGVVRYGGI